MNVGDYVRYKTLSNQIKINKIINIVEPNDGELSMTNIILYDLDNKDVTADKYIIKSSPNIMDLIKNDDILIDYDDNIYKVVKVYKDYAFTDKKNNYGQVITLVDYQIKKVITKEKFSSIGYEVN